MVTIDFVVSVCGDHEWDIFLRFCIVRFKFRDTTTANPLVCVCNKTVHESTVTNTVHTLHKQLLV